MRRFIVSVLVLSFLSLSFISCAALFNTGGGKVSFNSNPSGAEVVVDGQYLGKTPLMLELDSKTSHQILIKKDGKERAFLLTKKIGTHWIVLDVLGGLVPLIIDAATGSWYSLSPNTLNAQLE
jgi:hypothetical protein